MSFPRLSTLTALICFYFVTSPTSAESPISRGQFKERLIRNTVLDMPSARARVLADSVPGSVLTDPVFADGSAAHLAARCIALPTHSDSIGGTGAGELMLCVFSVPGTLYASVVQESTSKAWIRWDTTLVNDILQPALSILPAGGSDSAITILVAGGAAGLGGMRCFTLVRWSENFVGIVADRLCGTSLEAVDFDQDGVFELKITDIMDHGTSMTFEKYYRFDRLNSHYEMLEQESDSLHLQ